MYCTYNWKSKKKTKMSSILKKTLSLSIVYSKCGHEYEKIFREEESIKVLKIFGSINNIEEHNRIYNHIWRKYKLRI